MSQSLEKGVQKIDERESKLKKILEDEKEKRERKAREERQVREATEDYKLLEEKKRRLKKEEEKEEEKKEEEKIIKLDSQIPSVKKKIKTLKLENLIEEKKSILFESQLARLTRTAASLFILGFFISLLIFIVIWYFSMDQGSLNGFFNNIFCNKKSTLPPDVPI